ncbi:hypothetical protein OHU11_04580 [Streptomyces sp. NBC_00257]|uniref:hypothetical protein n=2 Tax=unclassified Streptomyces TaxID=2593676 RepID=UPI002251B955|nr:MULTISPECIES: hypothetical protein [unclassified Streptomyces]MCX4871004.1 hypothetical protein [Streptomyces sp. NBC_00906]MCX4901744.1 hypothetical protein [Streptomyces sp. NBC_00892]MCX5426986.1 hypothetical protein [Streptomyces sp. NBC_00062]
MARPSLYPLELRKRAFRMVAEVRPDYDTERSATKAAAVKLGIGVTETLRRTLTEYDRKIAPPRIMRRRSARPFPRPGGCGTPSSRS